VTEWHAVKVFGREAEWIGRDGAKGSKVFVSGHLETEKWTGKDGTEKQRQVVVASEICRLIERTTLAEAAPDVGARPFADGSDLPF
jgi:single-strand DNA-binding protein